MMYTVKIKGQLTINLLVSLSDRYCQIYLIDLSALLSEESPIHLLALEKTDECFHNISLSIADFTDGLS